MAIELEIDASGAIVSLQALTNEAANAKRELMNATDPEEIKRWALELAKAEKGLKTFNQQIGKIQADSGFSKLSTSINTVSSDLGKFGTLAGSVGLGELSGGLGIVTAGIESFSTALMANPIAAWSVGITAVVGLVGLLADKLGVLEPLIKDIKLGFEGMGFDMGLTQESINKGIEETTTLYLLLSEANRKAITDAKKAETEAKNTLDIFIARGDSLAKIEKARKGYDEARKARIEKERDVYKQYVSELENFRSSEAFKGPLDIISKELLDETNERLQELNKLGGSADKKERERRLEKYDQTIADEEKHISDLKKLRDEATKKGDDREFIRTDLLVKEGEQKLKGLKKSQSELKNVDGLIDAQKNKYDSLTLANSKSLLEIHQMGIERFKNLLKIGGVSEEKIKAIDDLVKKYAEAKENIAKLEKESAAVTQEANLRQAALEKEANDNFKTSATEREKIQRDSTKKMLDLKLEEANATGDPEKILAAENALIKDEYDNRIEDTNKYIEETKDKIKELKDLDALPGTEVSHEEEIKELEETIKIMESMITTYGIESLQKQQVNLSKRNKAVAEANKELEKFFNDKVYTDSEKIDNQMNTDLETLKGFLDKGLIEQERYEKSKKEIEARATAAKLKLQTDAQKRTEALFKSAIDQNMRLEEKFLRVKKDSINAGLDAAKKALEEEKKNADKAADDKKTSLMNSGLSEADALKQIEDEKLKIKEKYEKKSRELVQASADFEKNANLALLQKRRDQLTEIMEFGLLTNEASANASETRANKEIDEMMRQKEAELALVGDSTELRQDIEDKYQKRSDEIEKAAFERDKKYAIGQALMQGALGVVNILTNKSTLPSPFDWIVKGANAAALVAATMTGVSKIKSANYMGGGSVGGGSSSATPSGGSQAAQPNFSFFGQQYGGNELGERNTPRLGDPNSQNITVDVKISESEITSTQQRIRRMNVGAEL